MVAQLSNSAVSPTPHTPRPIPSDSDDVVLALTTARALEAQGESFEAARWLRIGADQAKVDGKHERAVVLTRAATDLMDTIEPPPLPAVALGSVPSPNVGERSSVRPPAPKPLGWVPTTPPPPQTSAPPPHARPVSVPPPLPARVSSPPPARPSPPPLPARVESPATTPAAPLPPSAPRISSPPPTPARISSKPSAPPRVSSPPTAPPRVSSPPMASTRVSSPPPTAPRTSAAAATSARVSSPPATPARASSPPAAPRVSSPPQTPTRTSSPSTPTPRVAVVRSIPTPNADPLPAWAPRELVDGTVRVTTIRVAVKRSVRDHSLFVVQELEAGQPLPAGATEAMLVLTGDAELIH